MVDLDDFVEMTKMYAQGIVQTSPTNDSKATEKTESSAHHDSSHEVQRGFGFK